MNATRIIRRPKPRANADAVTRIVRQPAAREKTEEETRIVRKPGPGKNAVPVRPQSLRKSPRAKVPPAPRPLLLPLARFALVALVFGRERAAELLEGLGEREAARAKEHLSHLAGLSSAERQARVAVEFGMRSDPAPQLRALMAEAPEALKREIFRRLPPYHRSLFPQRGVEPPEASATPGLCAFAERLIREATR